MATFLDRTSPGPVDVPDIPVAHADVADSVPRETHETLLGVQEDETGTLHLALLEEQRLREAAVRELRDARRELEAARSETRAQDGTRAAVLIALEEELESRLREDDTVAAALSEEATRRARLEARLAERDAAVRRLVRALDREKRRTRNEVTSLARQLVLHERQLRARRAADTVRPPEDEPPTRLSRKVARARPLTSE